MVDEAFQNDELKAKSIEVLTLLNDRRYDTGGKKRSLVLHFIREALYKIFDSIPEAGSLYHRIDWDSRHNLREQLLSLTINGVVIPTLFDFMVMS